MKVVFPAKVIVGLIMVCDLASYRVAVAQLQAPDESTSKRRLLTNVAITGDNGTPANAFPLGKCQGDCDSSTDCAANLRCFQRNSGDPVPPGCTGTPVGSKDYCYDPNDASSVLVLAGDNKIPANAFPLRRCQGDCDNNDDCAAGLACYERNSGQAVPGCSGTPEGNKDYCVRQSDLPAPTAPVRAPVPVAAPVPAPVSNLAVVGDNGSPSAAYPLKRCQGDCDGNRDCATGLVCHQRNTGQAVPGCSGTPEGNKDYCVRQSDLPAPTPPVPAPVYNLAVVGDDGSPSAAYPLKRCQGDCDGNRDCATGLVCHQRNTGQAVPGCSGTPEGNKDYCVRQSDL